MKSNLEKLLQSALVTLKKTGDVPENLEIAVQVDRTKDAQYGDFASNLALLLAKPCKKSPREMAQRIVEVLSDSPWIEKIEIAGAGFINFFVKKQALTGVIAEVLAKGEQFGKSHLGRGQKILLEFVSANPTGPLHVGHGRSAAFGSSLANILEATGFEVSTEYYVNDAGRQMNILAASVWLRYLAMLGEPIVFPANAYKGDYVQAIAEALLKEFGPFFQRTWSEVTLSLPLDEPHGGDKELYVDALIKQAKNLLTEENFTKIHQYGLNSVLSDIQDDLGEFGVRYNCWFSEQSLMDEKAIQKAIEALKQAGHTYMQEGALWFKAEALGDEKDRVLIRANGEYTYFASDVAYHWNKYQRGYTRVINIFGADHHGYISRIKSAVKALGHNDKDLQILLVQFAILYRGTERVQMSTRSGSFVTLRELREEVGNDAARYFYVARKPEQHMDFDLDLAKSTSNDNPVYYIQYAHARICSVLKQLAERGLSWDEAKGLNNVALLDKPQEVALIGLLSRYPEIIEASASACEPHILAHYLRELANGLHSYYNAVTLLCESENLRHARLCLLKAVRQVLHNGLILLGVSAPESM